MTGTSIVSRFAVLPNRLPLVRRQSLPCEQADWHTLWLQRDHLPAAIAGSPLALRYLDLLGPLAWPSFPGATCSAIGARPPFRMPLWQPPT